MNSKFQVNEKSSLLGKSGSYEGEPVISRSGRHASITLCKKHGRPKGEQCCSDLDELAETSVTIGNPAMSSLSASWSHCHSPGMASGVDKVARRKLIIASVLCLLFMIAEAVGGFLANSLAIATDAAHLLTDFASFMISLFSLYLASRPATTRYSFGWYRAEVIGALTSVLMIWVVTGILVYMAVERLTTGKFEVDATIMLITAGVGVLVNLIMGLSLMYSGVPHGHSHAGGHGHGHSHEGSTNHSHGHDKRAKKMNINVRAALIHVIGDLIQSLGVFIAALIIFYRPDWSFIDPICTFLFSLLVLFTTFNIIKDVLNVFMEGIPKGFDFADVQKTLLEIPGVVKLHNLRVWSLSLDKVALSTHLAYEKGNDPAAILKVASSAIRANFDIFELTIQVEEYKEEMDDCRLCELPKA
ncbi:Zinc transporter 2 [Halotydeus destructor]|nr:Zinc transporter 2 [Halotydeus destructor]